MQTKNVSITINGRTVTATEGEVILNVARQNNIDIPHLCASPNLKPYGSCRLCIVEIEGVNGYPASCTTPIRNGMKVWTSTEKINELRRNIIELYLSEQSEIALEASHTLLNYAKEFGLSKVRYKGERRNYKVDISNPYFAFDPNKCIVCGRCVRACDEIQGTFAIHLAGRGFRSTVVAGANVPFAESNCVSCGACVKECPTEAIYEKTASIFGRPDSSVKTVCGYCGVGCSFDAKLRDGKVISLIPVDTSPVNQGHACVKGRFGWDFVYSPARLKMPLVKRNGKFEETSWDEAIEIVSQRLKDIIAKYGGNAVGGISSSRGTNEENYLMQKFMRCVVGTNNIDNCARVCHSATVSGMMESFGTGAATNSLSDIEKAELLMVIGANPTEGHPVVGARIKSAVRHGAKLIVIDPRNIELCKYADIHLRLRPGTNVAVMNGLANVIIEDGLHNKEFIDNRSENFDTFKETIKKYTPEFVEQISGVPTDLLRRAARMYATNSASMCCHGLGMSEHLYGSYGIMAMCNLAILTGNVGRSGTGINPLRGQNNVQGSCDMGAIPTAFTSYQKFSDQLLQEKFIQITGKPLPQEVGKKIPEMYDAILGGEIKALYIVGYDILQSDPNTKKVKKVLESLDFLVVHDIFLSETAELADIVLPAVSYLEKDGTFTNGERRIQRVNKVIEPPGQAKPDWEVMCKIANAMGYQMHYSHPSEIMDEIAQLTPTMAGITYEKLEPDGIQWPVPNAESSGTPVMHTEKFTRGKAKFVAVEYMPPGEEPSNKYPFTMVTGRILQHYNVGTMTRNSKLITFVDKDVLEIHNSDSKWLGIEDGEVVTLISRRGRINMPVRISNRVTPGIVFTTFHFPEQRLNELLGSSADVLSRCPEYKVSTVRIEKITYKFARRRKQSLSHAFVR